MMTSWWRSALGAGREPSTDQIGAIEAPHVGRRSVDAGAGTGKTTTLALRALYLIESGRVRADEIVVVTFTKKAAAEIGARIADTIDRAIASGARFGGGGRGVRCTTIHALAADILREFAFDFGLPMPPRAITDGEAYGIFHDAFAALLDGQLGCDASAFPIAELNRDHLERDLGKLALHLKNHGIAPETFASCALAEAERFGRQSWGQLFSISDRTHKPVKLEPKLAIDGAARTLEAEREARNVRVVEALLREFDRRLRERAVATYGDLIGETTRHVRAHPEIAGRLRERWRYVMVDESQDSSDLQLAFLEAVFGGPGDADAAGMMPVGDRRQAIYGFNGAGEDVMARLASDPDATHALVVNRRSPQAIVDAAHAVLAEAGIVDASTPKLVASVGPGTLACVRVEHFNAPDGAINDHVELEAAAIASEIVRLLADPATATRDIAILVRRRTHANAYVAALNARGIMAALDRRSGLFAADEIRDALAWMSLALDLGDRQAAVRILQSPLCGLSDATTIALADPKDWLDRILRGELDAALDADTRERLERVRGMLVAILPSVALPLSLAIAEISRAVPIAASYARAGTGIGAQAIVNLRSFYSLADAFAREMPGARLADFVADVERRILYDDEPQEAELDLDGVRVMTIHQAKGLEWPFVFVACSTKHQYGTSGPTDALVAYDRASGAFALKNDIDGRETFRWLCIKQEHDPVTGERRDPQPRKVLADREQARVFYVALTRAKRCVYVTAPTDPTAKRHATFLDAMRAWAEAEEPGVDLRFAPESVARTMPAVTAAAGSISTPTEITEKSGDVALGIRRPEIVRSTSVPVRGAGVDSSFRPRVSFTAISAFEQCPRMARLRYRLRLPDFREARPRYVGLDDVATSGGNAARLGSLTHRVLELWGRARIGGHPIEIDAALGEALLDFTDVTDAEAVDARARASRAIGVLAPYQILSVEEPFSIVVGETTIEGAMDLVARAPDGRIHVIDYKTGATTDEHYRLQLALYVYAAESRYGERPIVGAILRLTPTDATLTFSETMTTAECESAVADVGLLESDVAKVGRWCDFCAYNGSPCRAPKMSKVSALAARPRASEQLYLL